MPQSRWSVAFRLVLALPALLLLTVLFGSGSVGEVVATGGRPGFGGLVGTAALLAWFYAMVRGRMARGLRDLIAYALSYGAQTWGYLLLVTDEYPDSDPLTAIGPLPTRSDPIRMEVTDGLRRSRLTVFFRLALAFPHLVWLSLWGVLALFAAIVNWFAVLFTGISPQWAHRFLAAYLRYQTHVFAFLYLVANPFPGFVGAAGSYPVELHVAERAPAEPLDRLLPPRPRLPGAAARRRLRPGPAGRRRPRLVRRPLHRPDAARPAQPRRLRPALHRPGLRLRLPADRRLPLQRAMPRRRTGAAGHGHRGRRPGAMTSSRSQAWTTAAVLIVVAAAWIWGVHALWSSVELPSLDLPQLDPHTYFSDSFLDRSATYGRFLAVLWLLGTATLIAVLVVYARNGERLARESAAGRVGTGLLLAMLGFAIVWLAEVPFDLAALWWQRRYDVSHQGYVTHLLNSFLGLGSQFVFVCLGFAILMGLAGTMRRWWWLAAVPCFVALALVFTLRQPLPDPGHLADRDPEPDGRSAGAGADRGRAGRRGCGSRTCTASRPRRTPSRPASGPTRTVILWDTLLDDDFSPAEIRLVLAHEIGHLAHDDPLQRVGWLALFLVPALGLIAFFTRRRGGLAWPEAVPLALLVLVVAQLPPAPLLNVAFRREEAAADWAALEATREPATDRGADAPAGDQEPQRPRPAELGLRLYENHPTIMQRIALAQAWEERSGAGR